jgi:response regulator RpfG family c-di-GMP phosphodiesterase
VSDMQDDADDWFAADDDAAAEGAPRPTADPRAEPWKVLIIDDDPQVHAVTRMVLGDLTFQDRPVAFISGYSAADCARLIVQHPDAAVVLLDVVMENDHAGLQAARHIRGEAGNPHIRIVLRTGQPGQAPERQVIDDYEIDDYKSKSELTADALYTAVKTALRSYRHITALESNRKGLEKIIDASATLMERRSLDAFADGVIMQLRTLIDGAEAVFLCAADGDVAGGADGGAVVDVVAGGEAAKAALSPEMWADIRRAFAEKTNVYADDHCVIFVSARLHAAGVVYIAGCRPLSEMDRRLLEVFCARVAAGLDNVHLYQKLLSAQRATVHALGKAAEFKDEVTGDHVRRIAAMSTAVAGELRARGLHLDTLDDEYLELIGLASVLHDVGKVGIPDNILMKPGRLDDDEMTVMRTHASKGGEILRLAAEMVGGRNYLSLGAEIADGHHEKFDGAGYPQRLAGQAIPLSARIVAVADVFDALIHPRPYKPAWEVEKALTLIREESGKHFDPDVVAAFFAVIERGAADIANRG